LTHVAVVRTLVPIGSLAGYHHDVVIPFKTVGRNGVRVVTFIQDAHSRKILGVAQQRL
jgi:hypothetical protein